MLPLNAPSILASITEPLVNLAADVVDKVGLIGVFVMMTLESACIPIPSEPTMMAAGFAASRGDFPFFAVVIVGTVANVIGSWIGYAIGYFGRYEALEKHHWLHLDPKQIARTERWFEKYGAVTVFVTRLLPIVRTFSSLPAGAAKMPLVTFTIYTAAGCFLWMLGLTYLGYSVGARWKELQDKLHYVDYAVAVIIVLTALWLAVRWWRRRGQGGSTGGRSGEPETPAPAASSPVA